MGKTLNEQTYQELRHLLQAWDCTPWWQFWARNGVAAAIVAKLQYRLVNPEKEVSGG